MDNFCRLKNLDPFTKTSTGDTNVTTSCCVTMCIIHFANGLEQCIDWTYSGTKSLISYPSFKELCHGKLCNNMTCAAGEWAASNTFSMIASKERQGISRWSGHGISWSLTFTVFLVSSYINQSSSMLYWC